MLCFGEFDASDRYLAAREHCVFSQIGRYITRDVLLEEFGRSRSDFLRQRGIETDHPQSSIVDKGAVNDFLARFQVGFKIPVSAPSSSSLRVCRNRYVQHQARDTDRYSLEFAAVAEPPEEILPLQMSLEALLWISSDCGGYNARWYVGKNEQTFTGSRTITRHSRFLVPNAEVVQYAHCSRLRDNNEPASKGFGNIFRVINVP